MASGSVASNIQGSTASSAPAPDSVPSGAGLVVLSRDEALTHTVRTLSSQYQVFTVSTESDLAAQLLAQSAGVAILDAGTVPTSIDRLVERLGAQFPDLVLIVAGGVDDQSALASQITNGTVYRFLHKPASEQRVRLFVDAAWRRHAGELSGDPSETVTALPTAKRPRAETNMLMLGAAVVAAIAVAGGWAVLHRSPTPKPHVTAVPPETLPTDADPRAAKGVEKVIDSLLSGAEAQLLAQHLAEAQRLTDQARAIKPDHVRVAFLMAQIAKERERAVLAQARQAAASGNIEQALTALDGAGPRSTLISEAREELEHKKLDERVHDYVKLASDRMRGGQLLEPAQDNAGYYIESARALAPNDAEVKQTQRQFLDRLVSEAHKALTAGNADQGEQWIQAAADAGVGVDDIAALKQEAVHVRSTAHTDALARLALLVNQRLSEGKLLDPSGDSAKFYLTQLMQDDPSFPSTQTARQAFATRTLDEAKSALRREDYAGAQRWLAEAREAGIDQTTISAVDDEIRTAQGESASAKQPDDVVSATSLDLTHYVAPEYPLAAQRKALSGWVDVQFIVKTDGSVSDPTVVGAEPAGVFEQPATEAVRKWQYQPILRDGQPINQRARVRVRFALEQ